MSTPTLIAFARLGYVPVQVVRRQVNGQSSLRLKPRNGKHTGLKFVCTTSEQLSALLCSALQGASKHAIVRFEGTLIDEEALPEEHLFACLRCLGSTVDKLPGPFQI